MCVCGRVWDLAEVHLKTDGMMRCEGALEILVSKGHVQPMLEVSEGVFLHGELHRLFPDWKGLRAPVVPAAGQLPGLSWTVSESQVPLALGRCYCVPVNPSLPLLLTVEEKVAH